MDMEQPLEQALSMNPEQDLDLIEILWRQDIDLGAERDSYDLKQRKQQEKDLEAELQQQREKEKELEQQKLAEQQNSTNNVTYTVDQETGELIPDPLPTQPTHPQQRPDHVPFTSVQEPFQGPQANLVPEGNGQGQGSEANLQELLPLQRQPQLTTQQSQDQLSVEDAMRLLEQSPVSDYFTSVLEGSAQNNSVQQSLQELEAMIENAADTYENRSGLQRQTSLEQRWQDISHILQPANNDTGFEQNLLLQNTSLAPQLLAGNISLLEGFSGQQYQAPVQNLLTPINSTQPHILPADALGLNSTAVLPQGGAGTFVNSSDSLLHHLLNDNLADMDFTELNITNTTEPVPMETNDVSSDSAISSAESVSSQYPVSSAGSPSHVTDLSDLQSNISSPYDTLEGATGGSNEAETPTYHSLEGKIKYESHDQSYTETAFGRSANGRLYSNGSDDSNSTDYSEQSLPPDPHKVGHNHTYSVQPGEQPKIGKKYIKEEVRDEIHDIQYTRDQKRAKSMNIPFTMEQMISSPVETFNEMIQRSSLSESQLQLVRDIRRRGKNKVAAQNCRKRKLEVIQSLEDEVAKMREERDRLERQRTAMDKDVSNMRQKFSQLYTEVFQSLRDEHNRPYDPSEYSLQQSDDGELFLVPRNASAVMKDDAKDKPARKSRNKGGDRKH